MRRLWFMVLLTTMSAMPARAATLTFDNLRSTGDNTFSIDVLVDLTTLNPPMPLDLFTFGFDVLYDPMAAELTGATLGPFLPGTDPLDPENTSFIVSAPVVDIDPDPAQTFLLPGSVFGSLIGYETGPTGSGLLATIDFRLLASSADVQFLNPMLFNSSIPQGDSIPTEILEGNVTLAAGTPVPEPSTIMLLGVGLVGLTRRRLRAIRSRAQSAVG